MTKDKIVELVRTIQNPASTPEEVRKAETSLKNIRVTFGRTSNNQSMETR